ncbi:hypothetical protein D9M70_487320 [compost metagenome]
MCACRFQEGFLIFFTECGKRTHRFLDQFLPGLGLHKRHICLECSRQHFFQDRNDEIREGNDGFGFLQPAFFLKPSLSRLECTRRIDRVDCRSCQVIRQQLSTSHGDTEPWWELERFAQADPESES